MGADRIAELTRPIVEVFAGEAKGEIWCATFTVTGDPDRWVQVTRAELNVAYPRDRDPVSCLAEVGLPSWAALSLIDWEPQTYATFAFPAGLAPAAVASIADILFVTLVRAKPNYRVEVEVFQIPP